MKTHKVCYRNFENLSYIVDEIPPRSPNKQPHVAKHAVIQLVKIVLSC